MFISVLPSMHLTPTWKPEEPDTLAAVTERRKVTGKQLQDAGYSIPDEDQATQFWFSRLWSDDEETWLTPVKVTDKDAVAVRDDLRSVQHGLGFVPIIWIKNLPGGDEIDGAPTFTRDALATVIEIDYQYSQAGRGLRYSSDPTLLIKEPTFSGREMIRSASNAITVDKDGDAKLLEINGSAASAVLEYVKALRETAIESMHGNRSNADKLSAAQSGRALELMHQALIWLSDKLRSSYGEGALLSLLKMIIKGAQRYPITIDGKAKPLNPSAQIGLTWPAWFPATADDKNTLALAIQSHRASGTLSVETAVASIASIYDIENVQAELAKIKADQAEAMSSQIALAQSVPAPADHVTNND